MRIYLININNINLICEDYKNYKFCLSLGSMPIFIIPYNYIIFKSLLSFGTQSMIYSKKCRENILTDKNILNELDWDIYTNLYSNKYLYYIPLITQIFSKTDNQNNWHNIFGLKKIIINALINNKLDKRPQPGFNNFYYYFKFINYLILTIIILLIIYFVFKYLIK